ncbi:hypothetical protein RB200_35260 [Streptomyces sp. PmtG]
MAASAHRSVRSSHPTAFPSADGTGQEAARCGLRPAPPDHALRHRLASLETSHLPPVARATKPWQRRLYRPVVA